MSSPRTILAALALLLALPAAAHATPAPATASATAPVRTTPAVPVAEGVACASTRACTPAHGGAYFMTSRNSCTAGLPVRTRAGQWYVLTAGHCIAAAKGAAWKQGSLVLGTGTRWEYGGKGTEGAAGRSDLGLIKVTANAKKWNTRSRVLVLGARGSRTQAITSVRDAKAGQQVCVTAGRSDVTRCGTVVQASTSLAYASPGQAARTIGNLALVRGICVAPGDSGSPVFSGSAGIGIVVARSATGCYTWYAKAPAALARYGLKVG